ncbi:MAG: DUF4430 domain-containing protein [Patescibacteria group bacterium]|mgnify:CR=1 FL=1
MSTRRLQPLFQHALFPVFLLIFTFVLTASISFVLSAQRTATIKSEAARQENASIASTSKKIIQPTDAQKKVLGEQTIVPPSPVKHLAATGTIDSSLTPTSTSVPTQSDTSSKQQASTTTQTISPTTEVIQTPATSTPTPTSTVATATLEIQDPTASSRFPIEITNGMNVCDLLQKAKDTGKIVSVTFDDSYMASLNSRYVVEINGYQNNWTFTVNGSSPLGCSLTHPKPNDTIVWKFG